MRGDFVVIIPVVDQHQMTLGLIYELDRSASQYYYWCGKKVKLVIVDNGSKIPFYEFCSGKEAPRHLECRTIRNETNNLYAKAINQGLAFVNDEHIILLNNDTVIQKGFFRKFRQAITNGADLVGPLTNNCCGIQRQSQCGMFTLDDPRPTDYKFDVAPFRRQYGNSPEVKWINGFCMCISNDAFQTIGPLDAENFPLSSEEMDYAIRAQRCGYKMVIDSSIFVYHYKHVTGNAVDVNTKKAWAKSAARMKEMYPNFTASDQFINYQKGEYSHIFKSNVIVRCRECGNLKEVTAATEQDCQNLLRIHGWDMNLMICEECK